MSSMEITVKLDFEPNEHDFQPNVEPNNLDIKYEGVDETADKHELAAAEQEKGEVDNEEVDEEDMEVISMGGGEDEGIVLEDDDDDEFEILGQTIAAALEESVGGDVDGEETGEEGVVEEEEMVLTL